jgi:hypothetical protein
MERAYNPQTGEYLFLVNGQWVPPAQEAINPQTKERAFLINNEWQIVPGIGAKPEDQSIFRSVADVPLKLAGGVTQGVRMVADAFGAGSGVSESIKGVEDWIAQFYSAQSKKDSQEVSRLMKEAEDKGVLDQVKAGIKAFSVAPVDMLSSALGTSAPVVVASLASIFGGAPALATRAIGVGLGAVMGAGTVKGSIYEAVKEELKDTDMPKEQIEARAKLAQEYGGKNLDMILAGTALGGLSGVTGLEGSLAKAAAARVLGKAAAAESAEQAAKDQAAKATAQAAARGPVRQAAVVGGKEAGTEFAQAGQERTAENIALQREGFDVPTFRGAVAAGTLEGLAGAGLGAGFGAREAVVAREEQARLERLNQIKSIVDEKPRTDLSTREQIAELSQRYQAQMPKELADEVATRMVNARAQQVAAAQGTGTPAPSTANVDPKRVAEIEDDLISVGVPPAEARADAIVLAMEEAQAETQVKPETENVAGTVPPAGGAGVSVAGEPVAGASEGAAGTEPTGVVSPTEDAGVSVAGEKVEPVAVTPTKPTKPTKPLDVTTLTDEQLEAIAEDAVFFGPDAETEAAKAELARRKGAPSAAETEVAEAAAKPSTAPAKTVEELEAEADAADAAYKRKIADAADMGRRMAITAFETRGNYTDLEESIGSLRDNVRDTLVDTRTELGLTKDQEFINAENAAFAAFDKEVERLRAAERPNIADPKFAETPPADTLYRATTEKSRYPGKFWTSIQELADRYLRKATGKEQRAIESTSELPKRALNVTTLSQADEATRKAMLDEFIAWLKTNYPDVAPEDTRLYDILAEGESDFAYPTIYDNEYLQSKGYDSVFFAEEGGETVNTWFVFDKEPQKGKPAKAATPTTPAAPGKRGRPKLTEEQREASQQKKREAKTTWERNNRALAKATELLKTPETRTEGLHMLRELRSTSLRKEAQAAIAQAGVTPAEMSRIEATHADWRKQRAEDKAEAQKEREEKAAKKAARPSPEQIKQLREEKKAAKLKDSTVYVTDPDTGRVYEVPINADSIREQVKTGQTAEEAKQAIIDDAVAQLIKAEGIARSDLELITKQEFVAKTKAEEKKKKEAAAAERKAKLATPEGKEEQKKKKEEAAEAARKVAQEKKKQAADRQVRSKQDTLRAAKTDTDKQIAQLELDEAKVEQKLAEGVTPEQLGLPENWREGLREQKAALKTEAYIKERNRILESKNRDLLERVLSNMRLKFLELQRDVKAGAIAESDINWGAQWSEGTPIRSLKEAQAELDAYAARLQALPAPKGKAKAKDFKTRMSNIYGTILDKESTMTEEELEKKEEKERQAEEQGTWQEEDGKPPEAMFQATRANVATPNEEFSKDTTGAQAAARLARVASNKFQRLLALRLTGLRVLRDVKFVVLETGDPTPIELVKDLGWAQARGAYVADTNTVYVKGESFGYMQGINNITILHELLHAALHRKIQAGRQATLKRLVAGEDVKQIERLFYDLKKLAGAAEKHFRSLSDMPEGLYLLVSGTANERTGKYDIFSSPDEFLSYGMSDPVFQEFLKTVPVDVRDNNGFSMFVRAILRFLGLAANDQSALTKLVDITDQFISVKAVPRTEISGVLKQSALKQKATAKKEKINKTLEKVKKTNLESKTLTDAIGDLITDRDASLLSDILGARYDQFRGATLRQLLPTLQTETIVEWAGRLGLNGVVRTWEAMKRENAMRYALINRSLPVAKELTDLQRTDSKMFESLGVVMHYATLRGVDPATEEGRAKSPALKSLWEKLSPEAKKLYVQVRDHYRAYNDLYHDSLVKRVEDAKVDEDSKKNLLASIRQIYETSNKISPYFPLMRYGQFWVRIGKGKSGEFHMFENQHEKELFIRQWVREQVEKDPKTSRAQLYADGAIEDGNNVSDANGRSAVASYNETLQKVFTSIDDAVKRPVLTTDDFGNVVNSSALVNADKLKDDVYQLMLHTLPDKSFRRRFIHRKGKAGFSKDIARNFASLTMDMANQLSRMRYRSAIEGAVGEAAASVEGNPDQAKLSEFVAEMRVRAQQITDPNFDDSVSNRLVNFTNTTTFLWLMTTVKTAIAQAAAIPVFVAPVLASRYGVFAAHAAIGRFTNVFNNIGVREKHSDGSTSWVAPTVAQSRQVKLNEEERRAAQYMIDRGISDTTMAFDLGSRRELPTHVQNSMPRRILRSTSLIMTGLFHNVERLNREITFMAAFRLARKKNKDMSFEDVAAQAEQVTYEALGNYASINRPRGIGANAEQQVILNAHQPLGRALLQFKMFPAFVTTYMTRNFWRIVGTGYSAQERKVAATQLFGTLGYSLSLAGVMGIPGVTFALGILSGLRNLGIDEEDDDELIKRDLELYLRNVWIPDTFGEMKVGGISLSNVLDRGLIAELTGKDITSSLSFNNMWFPESKEEPTAAAAMQSFLLHMLGPTASLVSQWATSIDKFNQGKVVEGMERLMPGLVRPVLTSYRYGTEGATTPAGAAIKPAEEFTTGELVAQAMGFSTEGLVAQRETLFKVENLKKQIENSRKSLLNRLALETTRGSEDINKMLDKIIDFNRRNPTVAIDSDTINTSLKNRFERMYATERGLPIEPRYYPLVRELFNVPIEKLEAEAERARK